MKYIFVFILGLTMLSGCGSEPSTPGAEQLSRKGLGNYYSMYQNQKYSTSVSAEDVLNSVTNEKLDDAKAGELAQKYVDKTFAGSGLTTTSVHEFPQSDKHHFYIVKFQAKSSADMLQVVVLSNGTVQTLKPM